MNVCVFLCLFSVLKQALVNYDDIKNFIRQQVIKIFDGEGMCQSFCHMLRCCLCLSDRHLSLTERLTLLSCCCIIIYNAIVPVYRENGLLHVPHTDASRDGGLPRSARATRKRRFTGASWYPRCTRNAWTVGQTRPTRRPRTPRWASTVTVVIREALWLWCKRHHYLAVCMACFVFLGPRGPEGLKGDKGVGEMGDIGPPGAPGTVQWEQ